MWLKGLGRWHVKAYREHKFKNEIPIASIRLGLGNHIFKHTNTYYKPTFVSVFTLCSLS